MIDLTRARALAKAAVADESGLAAEMAPVLESLCAEVEAGRTLRVMPRSIELFISREHHSPARIRAFLTALGWTLFKQYDECSEWTKDVNRLGWLGEGSLVMVLDSTRFSDYAHHVAMMVTDLAGLHGLGELGVLAGIEAADA